MNAILHRENFEARICWHCHEFENNENLPTAPDGSPLLVDTSIQAELEAGRRAYAGEISFSLEADFAESHPVLNNPSDQNRFVPIDGRIRRVNEIWTLDAWNARHLSTQRLPTYAEAEFAGTLDSIPYCPYGPRDQSGLPLDVRMRGPLSDEAQLEEMARQRYRHQVHVDNSDNVYRANATLRNNGTSAGLQFLVWQSRYDIGRSTTFEEWQANQRRMSDAMETSSSGETHSSELLNHPNASESLNTETPEEAFARQDREVAAMRAVDPESVRAFDRVSEISAMTPAQYHTLFSQNYDANTSLAIRTSLEIF